MGVSGLWDIVGKAGQSQSLAHLAVVNGFEDNGSGKRTYRVGIDASIWFKHAAYSKGGENPELRLLFFRLRDWAELPFSLLFVFDGHERPKVKRGSKMGKSGSHNLMAGMKKLLEIFGIEWRLAPGEAEAELAHLNRSGVIDAVLTDDVDALVFGALTIIKNPGLKLTGNKANPAMDLDGKASKNHVMMCTADAVRTHPQVHLTRAGLVLIALLSGGDYHDGVEKFGPGIAYGLARCGFGDRLLEILDLRVQDDTRLAQWREDVHLELRTNSRGFLPKRCPSCVLPANFPPRDILNFYTSPVTSAQMGRQGGGAIRDTGDMSLPRLAAFCETHFGEWGHASAIIKRFRDLIWEAAVMHILRRAALEADEKEKTKRINAGSRDLSIRGPLRPSVDEAVGTPEAFVRRCLDMNGADRRREAFVNQGPEAPNPTTIDRNALKMEIVGSRKHVSTDRFLEYRIELCPSLLVSLARKGIRGKRPEPSASSSQNNDLFNINFVPSSHNRAPKGTSKLPPNPESVMRMWLPASMIQQVHPELIQNYEAAEAAKRSRKAKGKGKARAIPSDEDVDAFPGPASSTFQIPVVGGTTSSQSSVRDAPVSRSTNFPPRSPPPNEHSLPTTPKGFLFWFPDPDDPDMLIPEDGLPLPQTRPSIIPPPLQPPRILFAPPSVQTMPQPVGSSSRRPVHPRTIASSSAPVAATYDHLPLPDNTVEPPRDDWDPFFDSIMGINSERSATSTNARNSAQSRPAGPAHSKGKNRGRQTDRANFTYDFADLDDEDVPSRDSNSAPGSSQRSTVVTAPSSRAPQVPRGARRSIRGRAPGRRTDRANFTFDFSTSEDDNNPPRAGPSHDTEPRGRVMGITQASGPTPSATASTAKRPRQSISAPTASASVPPAPSAEPQIASPAKKSKTTHTSRTHTIPVQLQPSTSQHNPPQTIPARPPVDPDIIDLSSDSDGPPRRPLPRPVHSVQTQKLMSQRDSLRGRRYIPEPTSSQESGLVDMSDVSVMIDLT